MKYTFSYKNPSTHYIDIEFEVEGIEQDEIELQFPAWRPGRYQIADFVKNVQRFHVYDKNGNRLETRKFKKDAWKVNTKGIDTIVVDYNYYAFEMNAGSTWLDDKQLYVNPVNCCVYIKDRASELCEIQLKVPDHYHVACGLKFNNHSAKAKDYNELADSPFIASGHLQHHEFDCKGVKFHLWFNSTAGKELLFDWERIIKDIRAYTVKQIEAFGEFPVDEYHYLYQIAPYQLYHGVEHQNSTVISLGPEHSIMTSKYSNFLGVSSHELYHTWNVKAIRPIEMHPYDFSCENYSRLGYVAEGVTTYLGDIFLFKSKVFDVEAYLKELTQRVQIHHDNPGRYNLSVADSSFDTWLDGYEAGVPGRKVSIYTEGCLLAFILDMEIMRSTENKRTLHDLMRVLYENYAKKGKGFSESDYRKEAEKVCGKDLGDYFDEYVNGISSLTGWLNDALEYVGLKLEISENPKSTRRIMGVKLKDGAIFKIASGSPAEMAGVGIDDKIIAVNGRMVSNDLDDWISYFEYTDTILTIDRKGEIVEVTLPTVEHTFYKRYKVVKLDEPNHPQREAYNMWSGKKS